MTKIKRIASMAAATALAVSMVATTSAVSAFADEASSDVSVTIKGGSSTHTYCFYQVFSGTISDEKLTNIEWGSGVDSASLMKALNKETAFENCSTASDVAAVLGSTANNKKDSSVAKAFANIAADYLSTTKTDVVGNAEGKLSTGYYLIKDDTSKNLTGDSFTRYVLELIGDDSNEEIVVKSSAPTITKKVKEEDADNYSNGGYNDWADYCMGESVPFKLTGTLPDKYDDYSFYTYTFHDTLCDGLVDSVDDLSGMGVTVKTSSGTDITKSFTKKLEKGIDSDGKTVYNLTVSCDDLKSIKDSDGNAVVKSTDKIIVTYNATLDDDAVVGLNGNENNAYLEYSNNPNSTGAGDTTDKPTTGNTPEDTVIVFTYEVDVTKVDADNSDTKLAGAVFSIKNSDGKYAKIVGGKVAGWTSTYTKADNGLTSASDGTFTLQGLDNGTYTLTEEEAPSKYVKLSAPITFSVVATQNSSTSGERKLLDPDDSTRAGYDDTGDCNEAKEILKGVKAVTTSTVATAGAEDTTTCKVASLTVKNTKKSLLPGTGGMGTTLFYVCGGTVAAGAAILLVVRKRAKDKAE